MKPPVRPGLSRAILDVLEKRLLFSEYFVQPGSTFSDTTTYSGTQPATTVNLLTTVTLPNPYVTASTPAAAIESLSPSSFDITYPIPLSNITSVTLTNASSANLSSSAYPGDPFGLYITYTFTACGLPFSYSMFDVLMANPGGNPTDCGCVPKNQNVISSSVTRQTLDSTLPVAGSVDPGAVATPNTTDSPSSQSIAPVYYSDGVVDQSDTDIESDAAGMPWSVTRDWTNNPQSVVSSNIYGNGVAENQMSRLIQAGTSFGIATNGNDVFWFDPNGEGGYASRYGLEGTFTSTTNGYVWTDPAGNVTSFYGFSSWPALQQGQMESFTSASVPGTPMVATYSTATSTSYPALGMLENVSRTFTEAQTGDSITESFVYSYTDISAPYAEFYGTSPSGDYRVSSIQLVRADNTTETSQVIDTVLYSYYGKQYPYISGIDSGSGNYGDLEYASTYDGNVSSGTTVAPVNVDYYQYWTTNPTDIPSDDLDPGALRYVVTGPAFDRFEASLGGSATSFVDPDGHDPSAYADFAYNYNSDGQISSEVVAGAAGTAAGGGLPASGDAGQGTMTYDYVESDNAAGVNSWQTKTIVTYPNGSDEIVYTNAFGQVMLDVIDPDPSSGGPLPSDASWATDYQYNSAGEVIQIASPSSFNGSSGDWYDDANADPTSGFLWPHTGLVQELVYGTSNTLTGTVTNGNASAGDVTGYAKAMNISQGTAGTQVPQEAWNYVANSYSGGPTVYFLSSDTVYGSTGGGDARVATYTYTFYSGTNSIKEVDETLPSISGFGDGPAASDIYRVFLDPFGNALWTQDGDGHVNYDEYNTSTGAVVMSVTDVNFASPPTAGDQGYSLSSLSWSGPAVAGLALTAYFVVDPWGRTIQTTSPDGNTDYIFYDDTDHEIREYDGWVNGAPTGPTQVYDENWYDGFTETLTMLATPSTSSGLPTGLEPISDVQSLSRTYVNPAGQSVETDDYYNLSVLSTSYSASTLGSQFGSQWTPGTSPDDASYYATLFDYDDSGNLDRTVDADGTIDRTVYNSLNEPTSSWVGTADGSSWTPADASEVGNMVKVADVFYDGATSSTMVVGDGNVTQTIDYPGDGQPDQVTTAAYDWEDRQYITTTGAGSSQPIVLFSTLDNAGETTEIQEFAGNASGTLFNLSSIGGVTTNDSSLLRAQTTISYDDQGQAYQTASFNVSPSTSTSPGTVGTPEITLSYFDQRGDDIATEYPTGLWSKVTIDGAGRTTAIYETDGFGGTGYSAASTATGDHVLADTLFGYDGDDNVILTTTADRFGTDPYTTSTGTSIGLLGSPTSGIGARVSYMADYYDADDRNVAEVDAGTDGGTAYTAPGTYTTSTASATTISTSGTLASGIAAGDQVVVLTGTGAGERAIVSSVSGGTITITSTTAWALTPGASSTFTVIDPLSLVTQTTYTAAGYVDRTVDPRGISTSYASDALGRTVATVAANNTWGPLDPSSLPASESDANQTTTYQYDGLDQVTLMTAIMPSGENNQETQYNYGTTTTDGSAINSNDLLGSIYYPDPTSGDASSSQAESYTYTALGDVGTYTDRNGTKHTYSYSALDQLLLDSVSFGTSATGATDPADQTVTALGYGYNDAGLMSSATSYNSGGGVLNQIDMAYNGFGDLVSSAQSHDGSVGTNTPSVGYTFDVSNGDRMSGMVYPDGYTLDYDYATGLSTAISQLSSISDSGGSIQSYTDYLGLGMPGVTTDGNGVTLSYMNTAAGSSAINASAGGGGDEYTGLDRFGRIDDQNWGTQASSTSAFTSIDRVQTGYDQDSNVTYLNDLTSGLSNQSETFTNDNLNRLTGYSRGTITISGGTASIGSPTDAETWSLDALGNWTANSSTEAGVVTSSIRNNSSQNQILSINTTSGGVSTPATLGYDADGNTTADENGDTDIYDAWNRLVAVDTGSGGTATTIAAYTYDADGGRITETESGATTDLYYSDQWQVLEERQSGTTTGQYVWSPFDVDKLVERESNPDVTTNESNGSIDTTFGTDSPDYPTGTTTTPIGDTVSTYTNDLANLAVSMPDGTIFVAVTTDSGYADLLKYTADGALETSFGTDGILTYSAFTSIGALALASNGDLLAVVQNGDGGMQVAEIDPSDGSLVAGFGTDGVATVQNDDDSLPAAGQLTVTSDGNIVLAGTDGLGDTIYVAEVNAAGLMVSGFGTDGVYSTGELDNATGLVCSLSVTPDGTVFVGASSGLGDLNTGCMTMVELAADGTAIGTFGTDGVVNSVFEEDASVAATAFGVRPDGEITVVGTREDQGETIVSVFQFAADGSPETTATGFLDNDTEYTISSDFSLDPVIGNLVLWPDGSFIVGGIKSDSGDIGVVECTANFTLSSDFGSGGVATGAFADGPVAAVLQPDGKLILVGTYSSEEDESGDGDSIILQRFNTEVPEQRLYAETDANDDVTSITDSTGSVVERYEYTPYGVVTVLNPDGSVRGDGTAASSDYNWVYLHQGLRLDVVIGMYNNNAREYDPALGRFLQEDPYGYVDGPNRYQTEASNPTKFVDPSGLDYVQVPQPYGRAPKIITDPDECYRYRLQHPGSVDPEKVNQSTEQSLPLDIDIVPNDDTGGAAIFWSNVYAHANPNNDVVIRSDNVNDMVDKIRAYVATQGSAGSRVYIRKLTIRAHGNPTSIYIGKTNADKLGYNVVNGSSSYDTCVTTKVAELAPLFKKDSLVELWSCDTGGNALICISLAHLLNCDVEGLDTTTGEYFANLANLNFKGHFRLYSKSAPVPPLQGYTPNTVTKKSCSP